MRFLYSLIRYQSITFFVCLFFFSNSALNAAVLKGNYGSESASLDVACSGNCPSITTSPVASGKYSSNYTLSRNMHNPYRSEGVLKSGDGNFDFGKEYWMGMSYQYGDWKNDSSPDMSPFQIHTRPSRWDVACGSGSAWGQSPFFMSTENGIASFTTYKGKTLWSGPVQKKQWLNIVVHFRLSAGNDGFIEVWKDGTKLGRVDGPNGTSKDDCGKPMRSSFLKVGIYKWDWKKGRAKTNSDRRQIFIDNIKIAEGSDGFSLVNSSSNSSTPAKVEEVAEVKEVVKVEEVADVEEVAEVKEVANAKKPSATPAPTPAPTTSQVDKEVKEGSLAGHWWLSPSLKGTTVPDSSGNGFTGKLVNGAKLELDKGFKFDGINDYLDLGKLNMPDNAVTVSAWFMSEDLSNCPYSDCRIISKAASTRKQDHYFMISTVKVGEETRLRFRLKTNGETSTLVADTGNIHNNEWAHVTAVYDGKEMILYKDGVEVGSKAKQGSITANSNVPVWIGNNPAHSGSRPWKGNIDDVKVYNYALPGSEILKLAQ